jgi:proline iminopeptidase
MGRAPSMTVAGGVHAAAGQLVRIDDTSLWVESRGPDEGHPLIVLHGGPGLDHHEFADYLDPLTDSGVRLLLVDQRAQGRSLACDPRTWTLERHAQDVIMLARSMRLSRYGVLGHSYGAFVALQNAVDFPNMAAQTIVSCGVASSSRWFGQVEEQLARFEPEDVRRRVVDAWAREETATTPEDVRSIQHDRLPFHFADPTDARIAEYEARSAGAIFAPRVLRHVAMQTGGGIEVEDRLAGVPHPVLVMAGRHDRTCVVDASIAMVEHLPNAELTIFERSGHMPFVEEPDAYAAAVRSFLARTA